MTSPLQVQVQQESFGNVGFWRRLEHVAAEQGHDGHQLQLVGRHDPNHVYDYRCQRCKVTLVEVTVMREA